ncbi:DNA repair protein RecN [Omnitrophica bacterium]|nr:DNA repair protein RecN [Candidatus Omnitrophota bacterium]
MLQRLHVENFALVENLTLEFDPRMNVLTGETGAGKSLVIDALRFVLGERMDLVRGVQEAGPVCVEAVFDAPATLAADPLMAGFVQAGQGEDLIMRREMTAQGKARAWVNQRSVNVSFLKQLSSHLLDIHGQYDHQLLLDADTHLELVDRYGKTGNLLESYQALYARYDALQKRAAELKALKEGRAREMDLLQYQIEEIERAGLAEDEEIHLKTERVRLANAEKLYEVSQHALDLLDGDDRSVSTSMGQSARDLEGLTRLDESLAPLKDQFEETQLACEEIIRTLRDYQEGLSFDPDRLTEIDDRLQQIELLKRKYGAHVSVILDFLAGARSKYDKLIHSDLYEKEAGKELKDLLPKLTQAADSLTAARRKAAGKLHDRIKEELKDLGITRAEFACKIAAGEFQLQGRDRLAFMISLNPGQPLMELRKIISAGEVSRVMLAMKKVLMEADPVPVLIFDEIDANIGGRLGTVTGEKLKSISEKHQIILITHLPQIASFADRHFKVSKRVAKNRTTTGYEAVEGEPRVQELAQMMSGLQETEISKKHAEEMLSRIR